MDNFFKELSKLYDVEDFTGNIGVLLADDSSFENKKEQLKAQKGALDFLQSVYDIASKYL